MTKTWIDHSEYSRECRLAWFDEDDGEGGCIGDCGPCEMSAITSETNRSDREVIVANVTASKTDGVSKDSSGFYWEDYASANHALKQIKIALKNIEHPWPEWALKAKAAGWKSPKGWKP